MTTCESCRDLINDEQAAESRAEHGAEVCRRCAADCPTCNEEN